MSGKKKRRPQPTIQVFRRHKDEFRECKTPGCKSIIAAWSEHRRCQRCRSGNA